MSNQAGGVQRVLEPTKERMTSSRFSKYHSHSLVSNTEKEYSYETGTYTT